MNNTILPLLTPPEAAQILRIKLSTLYKYSMCGKLPVVKFEGSLRFRADELQKYIEEKSRQPVKKAVATAG